MYKQLKETVWEENMKLVEYHLVIFTWGNVSGVDRGKGIMAIKPSGVPYQDLTANDIVIMDIGTGKVIDGKLNPSSDAPTHLELYRNFDEIGGVVHTHSTYATSFAQACSPIKAYGTTHGDYFYGDVPCTRCMTLEEITEEFEKNTGSVIVETVKGNPVTRMNPLHIPGVLVNQHGPFVWGKGAGDAVHNAVVLEKLAEMAMHTQNINRNAEPLHKNLLDKHFLRKNGDHAYYGQSK